MPPRRVLIATPSYDGSLSAFYVNSLIHTFKDLTDRGMNVIPIFLSFDALIQRSRNDLLALAVEHNIDDIVFIDADIEWQPEWVSTLLRYKVDVVGGTYRKKTDSEEVYTVRSLKNPAEIDTSTGLMKVDGLGCGFLRLSRKAFMALWEQAEPYTDDSGKTARMVFEVGVKNGALISEDIMMCQKLKGLGFDVFLDMGMTCAHYGGKRYIGNFQEYYHTLFPIVKDSAPER